MRRSRAITLLRSGVADMGLSPRDIPRQHFDGLSDSPTIKEVMGVMIDIVLSLGAKESFTLERAKCFLALCLAPPAKENREDDDKGSESNGHQHHGNNSGTCHGGIFSMVRRTG